MDCWMIRAASSSATREAVSKASVCGTAACKIEGSIDAARIPARNPGLFEASVEAAGGIAKSFNTLYAKPGVSTVARIPLFPGPPPPHVSQTILPARPVAVRAGYRPEKDPGLPHSIRYAN